VSDLLQRFWVDRANCLGTDPAAFFLPQGASSHLHDAARRVCARCEVRPECLTYRLVTSGGHDDDGIWAGTSKSYRRDLRREFGVTRVPLDRIDLRALLGRVRAWFAERDAALAGDVDGSDDELVDDVAYAS
jgi:WhiB family redox-sensing transcriptional regulator